MSRTLLRYSQIRRTERVDSPATDALYALGRYFEADCLAGDVVGALVYITGIAVLGIAQVTTADPRALGKYPAVGMIAEKSTATRCLVQTFGESPIVFVGLTPGRVYFLDTTGLVTATPPAPLPGGRCAIQAIGSAIDSGRLLVNPNMQPVVRIG